MFLSAGRDRVPCGMVSGHCRMGVAGQPPVSFADGPLVVARPGEHEYVSMIGRFVRPDHGLCAVSSPCDLRRQCFQSDDERGDDRSAHAE
jgi:hypothetical protein